MRFYKHHSHVAQVVGYPDQAGEQLMLWINGKQQVYRPNLACSWTPEKVEQFVRSGVWIAIPPPPFFPDTQDVVVRIIDTSEDLP